MEDNSESNNFSYAVSKEVKESKLLDMSSENMDIFCINEQASNSSPIKKILGYNNNTNQTHIPELSTALKPSSFLRSSNSQKNSNLTNQLVEEEFELSEKKSITSIDSDISLEYINHPIKQKIIATVDKVLLDNTAEKNYDEYYTNIIFSGADFIKVSMSVLEDFAFRRLELTLEKLNRLMSEYKKNVPIIVSMEQKLMRFTNLESVKLKANERIYIKFANVKILEKESFLTKNEKGYKIYFINNYDQVISQNLRLKDKIIVDFGRGLFTITKIYYKDGRILELDDNLVEEETKENVKFHVTNDYFESTEHDVNNNLDDFFMDGGLTSKKNAKKDECSEILYKQIIDIVNNYFGNNEIPSLSEIPKEMEIDFVEAIVNYECFLSPCRPAQFFKQSK